MESSFLDLTLRRGCGGFDRTSACVFCAVASAMCLGYSWPLAHFNLRCADRVLESQVGKLLTLQVVPWVLARWSVVTYKP
ncbi:hypothetical protein FIBSPDRAFT_479278 [Athelia psychrophila]|uniref:Uncharacterized protein n=1 Tax=Athelia psychrophila TaxID=1759441 RepID=A0A166VCC3_9AGAM|nr:hypothetical protein FIBSPDRAFT_479278 [Fibularhizoctonia sp. CBS 109695]